MKIQFTYSPDTNQKNQMVDLFQSFEQLYIYQFPGWQELVFSTRKTAYFIATDEQEKVICYCIISEHFRIASIYFGPVCKDRESMIESIGLIREHYKAKHYGMVQVQLPFQTNQFTEFVQSALFARFGFAEKYSRENWSSLVLEIDKDPDQLKRGFTKGHKYDINRAGQLIDVRKIDHNEDLHSLATIYDQMYKKRRIARNFKHTLHTFEQFFQFFKKTGLGVIVGIFPKDSNQLIGGIVLVKQGNSMLYNYGTSDNNYKHLPILHLGIFESIKIAREMNCRYFDFGGFNMMVSKKDQVYMINRFKKGFGGKPVFYPKLMTFPLNKPAYLGIRISLPLYIKIKAFLNV